MAQPVKKLTEVLEDVWFQLSSKVFIGLTILIIGGALLYVSKYLFTFTALLVARILFGLVALAGAALVGTSIYVGAEAKKRKGFEYKCPYCDKMNALEAEPTSTFDCDHCNRSIHFIGPVPVPVRSVNCPFCQTEHRVATNVHRYVCDRCNRPLELKIQGRGGSQMVAEGETETAPLNFDVLLLAADRRHEIEIAMKLQNLLVVNLPEARRLMASASTTTPLVVSHNLPQRKAEAIRRQLQDVGATSTLRPTGEGAAPPAGAR